jgi:hypothetical protein
MVCDGDEIVGCIITNGAHCYCGSCGGGAGKSLPIVVVVLVGVDVTFGGVLNPAPIQSVFDFNILQA